LSYLAHAQAVADLDDLVMTHELASRPARAPDHAAENRALAELAQELVRQPEGVPGRVEEMLRALCRCGAAGTVLPDQHEGGVDWRTAGSEPVLLRDPARLFPSLRSAGPAPAEMLLLPWAVDGGPAGMLWVADPERRFDLEDARLLRSLSGFAAAALRLAGETAQRTAAERELHASHAILDAAMHTEAVGLTFYTLDGSIIDCNEALERMSGYSRDELRGTVR
jgi:PAS domain-containing protein